MEVMELSVKNIEEKTPKRKQGNINKYVSVINM